MEGSVSRAAERMGIGTPAMSRLLGQIREIYGDPIFVRSSRRLIPTPFAESLRQRLRALAAEAEALLQTHDVSRENPGINPSTWSSPPLIEAPPLTTRPSIRLEGEPLPEDFARKLAAIEKTDDPRKRLAKHVATTSVGIGQSRPLTMDEAEDAFSLILDGRADPVQIGALLSVLHYRGETAAELAGMVRAGRKHISVPNKSVPAIELDWPAYVSPKSRRVPWFLQAALLVARAGYRVLLHGIDGGDGTRGMLISAADAVGIPVCTSFTQATDAIAKRGIAYLPIAAMSSQLHRLLSLYGLLETRSSVNSLMPMLNPFDASASIMGVARPAYRELHRDAGALLGSRNLTVIGTSRDAAEATPFRSSNLFRLVDGRDEDLFLPAVAEPKVLPLVGMTGLEYWQAHWLGTVRDERATQIINATAAAALLTLSGAGKAQYDQCLARARELWALRRE
jgi:anthranilate phosphoribosyltransferase